MNSMRPRHSPVDRVRDQPPDDPEWRADALAQSGHSRLDDVLVEPLEDRDLDRAAATCGELTRNALHDFAPALVLLPISERRRVQAIAAFALTLFDFARQSGLEGEKLSQMNRWHFDLESTLDGDAPGQPVFMLLAAAETERPWPREALDAVMARARHRALVPRPPSAEAAEAEALALGRALAEALLPDVGGDVAPLAGVFIRVARLLALGEDRRRHQAGLAVDQLPEAWSVEGPAGGSTADSAIRAECKALRSSLADLRLPVGTPKPWRRALTYAVLASHRLVDQIDQAGAGVLERAPSLGALGRLGLVLRSRWLPLRSS